MYHKSWISCIFIFLPFLALGHSFNDDQLKRVESISNLNVQIAPRSRHFFEKRSQSPAAAADPERLPKKIEYDDSFRLLLHAYNQTFYLHLEPNLDLFHPEAIIRRSSQQQQQQLIRKEHVLVYKGHVVQSFDMDKRWTDVLESNADMDAATKLGWARILIRHDLMSKHKTDQPIIIEGAFKMKNDIYQIKTTTNYNLVKRAVDVAASADSDMMVIYRDSDAQYQRESSKAHKCGFDNLLRRSIVKRGEQLPTSTDDDSIGHEGWCPTTRKINYMGAAADCTYVQYYQSADNARIQIINNFNMASAVFEETFNISLGLIHITIMDHTCPRQIDQGMAWNRACHGNYTLGDRLSDFSLWRSTLGNDGAGLWHLMTNCATGLEVGLAWLKQICNTKATAQIDSDGKKQYVSGAGVSAITRDEWKVVAHEIGHAFGAIHDCAAGDCPCTGNDCQCCQSSSRQCSSGGFLMSARSNTSAENFSPCSIHTICNAFPAVGACLADPTDHDTTLLAQVYQLNVCGNGIKENDEECDTNGVDTDCCDATTCKLKPTAVCEDTHEGCCHHCQMRPKNDLCRPASSPCDMAEYCSGASTECPVDAYIRDGSSCGSGPERLACASGQCTSRDEQCVTRGSVLNVTQSCVKNNQECKLLCNSPVGNKCLIFSGNFIDGTPCGFGGRCRSGACQNGDAIDSSLLYLGEHLNVAIGVVLFSVMCILFGCWRCTGYTRTTTQYSAFYLSAKYYRESGSMELPGYCEVAQELIPTTTLFSGKVKHSLDFMTPPPYTTLDQQNSNDYSASSSSASSNSLVTTEDKMKTEKNE